jgi:hypothetical protein
MSETEAAKRTQDLIDAIEAISIAARWRIRERITVDFVTDRLVRGDSKLALAALDALEAVGVLISGETNGVRVYAMAGE